MSLLITLLATVALADFARSASRIWHPPTAVLTVSVATGAFLAANHAVGGTTPWWILCVTLITGLWVTTSDLDGIKKTASSSRRGGRRWPLAVVGGGVGAAIVLQPLSPVAQSPLEPWFSELTVTLPAVPTVESLLLLVAVILFIVETSNVIVRLALGLPLTSTGATETKGGRLIGPLERVLIFSLAVSGETLAISAVIAAKGLLRFPEISATTESGVERGNRAEQVIVGSLLSWILALAFVPLFTL